jgi:hypothetical protein
LAKRSRRRTPPHYQELYAAYFKIFCTTHFGADSPDSEPQGELLPLLKHQLEECRQAIINPRPETERLMRETELRRPTGDTVRLPRPGGFQRKHSRRGAESRV